MGRWPESLYDLDDKAPPPPSEPPGCLTLEDSPHPLQQETTGLDTIQATSLLLRKFLDKRKLC